MSSTNKTAELHLSQFIGTDIPSILTDYNGDMQKIDAGVREVKQATAGAVSDLSSVTARVTNAEQDISGLNSTVQGIATRVVTAEGDIDALQTSVASKADVSDVNALQDNVDDIEAVIPNGATASNKLVTNKLTLVQNFTRQTSENLGDFMLRVGSKIKELVDGGNSIKNIAVECVYPASNSGFLTLEKYGADTVIYSKLTATQNIEPAIFYFPTVTSRKEYATIEEWHLKFANTYTPGETTTYGTVTGYTVISDSTVEASALGTMQFNISILN